MSCPSRTEIPPSTPDMQIDVKRKAHFADQTFFDFDHARNANSPLA